MEDVTITLSVGLIRGIMVVVTLLIVFAIGFGAGCSTIDDGISHDDEFYP